MTEIHCMVDGCESVRQDLIDGVSLDTQARAAGWARFDYPTGPRYVCRGCRRPQGRAVVAAPDPVESPQLDLFM